MSGATASSDLLATTATVYNVTASWQSNVTAFGVLLGRFNQTFNDQTGSGVVLTTQYCHGTYTGLAGFWSISSSDNRYVASGKGYCITDFSLSLVYQGSGLNMHKRMTISTNGPGVVSKTLVNI
jgi:hypothetical protein